MSVKTTRHGRLFSRLRPMVMERLPEMARVSGRFILFASVSDGARRAITVTASGTDVERCWRDLAASAGKAAGDSKMRMRWLRVDWVDSSEALTWKRLAARLGKTKRNYFRLGISLDARFRHAFLETELNANAMLYGGPAIPTAEINQKNFMRYARLRHGLTTLSFEPDAEIISFSTSGLFIDSQDDVAHALAPAGRDAGRRIIPRMTPHDVASLVSAGSAYLASQVGASGRFTYGWHPCFDREIPGYNGLRHASSLYAMIEAYSVAPAPPLADAISRAMTCLTQDLIRIVTINGQTLAFLVEANDEIKLGGNAVAVLAICKYAGVMRDQTLLPLAEQLAGGILHLQDKATGRFTHVHTWPGLGLKDAFRIIYYDGEATFALMRLHQLTGAPALLDAVRRAFAWFISASYWNTHDHWLSYAAESLTRIDPNPDYYRFGIRNVATHLDFVTNRITTYPTLLELMMAAEGMVRRMLQDPCSRALLEELDLERFYHALETRAHYLLNGHFWPELAMFYGNPGRIAGSFFIRHHAFRVRIDDVEHYLSGLVAYHAYLLQKEAAANGDGAAPFRSLARGLTPDVP